MLSNENQIDKIVLKKVTLNIKYLIYKKEPMR